MQSWWLLSAIRTDIWSKQKHKLLPVLAFQSAHMPNTPPFGMQPAPKQSLWGLQHSQSGLLKYTVWQINRATIQGRSFDWDLRGVNRREETHSTLINTWPHYQSHVAESHWGRFNTTLLSWALKVGFHVFVWVCHWRCVCVRRVASKWFVHRWHTPFVVFVHLRIRLRAHTLCAYAACQSIRLHVSKCVSSPACRITVPLMSDSINSLNIALMRE